MKSWSAGVNGGALLAPTLGTWRPTCAVGDVLSGGMCFGRIRRAGKWLPICMPQGKSGRVTSVLAPFSPVEFEAVLLELGSVDERASEGVDQPEGLPENTIVLRSPMSGTLYHQASPGAPAFAPVGSEVEPQATLALVEVMKSLTPVRNAQRGRIVRWLVCDGEAVRAGQALLWIEVPPQ